LFWLREDLYFTGNHSMSDSSAFSAVRFTRDTDFIKTLRSRVKTYFEANGISHYGNTEMYLKTFFMLLLFYLPYSMIVTQVITSNIGILIMYAIMGLGMAGIGLSIMHDANHGAYSQKKWVNQLMGLCLNLMGGNAAMWRIQHNILHHSFTNIEGMDEDIDPPAFLLRFSPHRKRNFLHRFQHYYAWVLYGLMSLSWVILKDFQQFFRYKKMGLNKTQGSETKVFWSLLFWKMVYWTYIIIIPIWVLNIQWHIVLLGFLTLQFITGLILAAIFQPAHVIPESTFPLPNEERTIENNFAVHQLSTTANFASQSRWFSWFVGGLNYQVEHHLFPNICHVHYRSLSPIVEQTAREYGLPYHQLGSFANALKVHTQMLKKLGRED